MVTVRRQAVFQHTFFSMRHLRREWFGRRVNSVSRRGGWREFVIPFVKNSYGDRQVWRPAGRLWGLQNVHTAGIARSCMGTGNAHSVCVTPRGASHRIAAAPASRRPSGPAAAVPLVVDAEVDETYIGGSEAGRRGRGSEKKALVVVAAQEDGRKIGRVRMRRVKDASADSLQPFFEGAIEPGSVVRTDGWGGYVGLAAKGYVHEATPQGRLEGVGNEDDHLDEYTFRFNRRTSRHRGKLFYRLMQQAVAVDPAPYDQLVKRVRGRPKHNRSWLPEGREYPGSHSPLLFGGTSWHDPDGGCACPQTAWPSSA